MAAHASLLANLKLAHPCPAEWDDMTGDHRVRRCTQCQLNVYNISVMSTPEAEALLKTKEQGRVCIRFYRRADGTVLTQDCPVGWRAAHRRLAAVCAVMAAAVLTGISLLGGRFGEPKSLAQVGPLEPFRQHEPLKSVLNRVFPPPPPPIPAANRSGWCGGWCD